MGTFKRYDGFVMHVPQEFIDGHLPVCPFCHTDHPHWLLDSRLEMSLTGSRTYYRCEQCEATLSSTSMDAAAEKGKAFAYNPGAAALNAAQKGTRHQEVGVPYLRVESPGRVCTDTGMIGQEFPITYYQEMAAQEPADPQPPVCPEPPVSRPATPFTAAPGSCYCSNCGALITVADPFCFKCGARQNAAVPGQSRPASQPQPAWQSQPTWQPQPVPVPNPAAQPTNGGVKGKILGGIGFGLSTAGLFFAVLAILFAVVSMGMYDDDLAVFFASYSISFAIVLVGMSIAGLILSGKARACGNRSVLPKLGKIFGIISIILYGVAFFAGIIAIALWF